MSTHRPDATLIARRTLVIAPTGAPATELPTRHFDLPPVLHAAVFALFAGFLAIMGATFAGDRMGIVMAICGVSLAGMFGVPALFQLMGPAHSDRATGMAGFRRDGIDCHTGHLSAGEASAQMLILPVLILGWAVAIAVITAVVA